MSACNKGSVSAFYNTYRKVSVKTTEDETPFVQGALKCYRFIITSNDIILIFRKPENGGLDIHSLKRKKKKNQPRKRNNGVNVSWQRPAEGYSCQKKKLPLIDLSSQHGPITLFIGVSLQQMHKKALINVIALTKFLFVTASKYKSAYSGHLSAGCLPALPVSALWRLLR